MISIERSETNKKRALEIRDKIFFKGNFFFFFFCNFSIKHDILRLFEKKNFCENFQSPNFVLDSVLDQKFSKSKIFFKGKFFFHNFSIKHDILRLFAKKKFSGEKFSKSNLVLDLVLDQKFSKSKFFLKGIFFLQLLHQT